MGESHPEVPHTKEFLAALDPFDLKSYRAVLATTGMSTTKSTDLSSKKPLASLD